MVEILDLGVQHYTGRFPKAREQEIPKGPLRLVWCPESSLVQLGDTFPQSELFGDEYGYRSGLNASMVKHLSNKIQILEEKFQLKDNDIVVDIGSNDATTLKSYKNSKLVKIGIDPTGKKFKEYYTSDISLIADFFSAEDLLTLTDNKKVHLVTSISMFYDLDDPIQFAKEIKRILHQNGVWHFEQSYLPTMLKRLSYDTICHEHVTYLSLHSIEKIVAAAGLKILSVGFNDINGGSFYVNATHKENSTAAVDTAALLAIKENEEIIGLTSGKAFEEFSQNVLKHKTEIIQMLTTLKNEGKTVLGYGASTKGNVLLQYCGITESLLPAIAEVNPDKFGSFTPGTKIPIISEDEAKKMNPDYYFVLPWHFKENIIERERSFLGRGGCFIFPLPEITIYSENSK